MKTNGCEEKGYHLIHVLESDWTNKNEQVKKFLQSCIFEDENFQESNFTVRNISFEIAKKFSRQFIICNSLKKSNQYYGLVDNKKRLVAVIGISIKKKLVFIENFTWAYSRNSCFSMFLFWLKSSFPSMVLKMKIDRMFFEESFLPSFGFSKLKEKEPSQRNVFKKLIVYDCGHAIFYLNP